MALLFADVRFDAAARRIWRGPREAHLTTKAFDLLDLLLERRPQVVSKREIHDRLWPGTFVSDANLPALIAEIRDALGDEARRPRFMRTVHGLGYGFCADVTAEGRPRRLDGASAARWWLIGAEERIGLFDGENLLGREGEGLTLVHSSTVSRRHARITVGPDAVVVEDLGSKNGTYVCDEAVVGPRTVEENQTLRLGSARFVLKRAANAESKETTTAATGPDA